MAKVTIINNLPVVLASGSQTYGPANVGDSANQIILHLARCTTLTPTVWPLVATLLDAQLQASVDGGPFNPCNGFGGEGGIAHNRDGSERTEIQMECDLPAGINRRVQVLVTVTSGPLVSLLTVDVI